MRLAVLGSSVSWYVSDLRRAAGERHSVVCLPFSALSARLGTGLSPSFPCSEHRLETWDAVLVRSMPPGSLEQVVFRMDVLARLEQCGIPVINPPRALEAAIDKYLASAKLLAAGLRTPATIVCQSWEDAMAGYAQLGGDVVVKPLFGGEGRGILRVEDPALAQRVFKSLVQTGAVLYLQQFIPHAGFDIRLLVIGQRVLSVRRIHPTDWRTNVSLGARAEAFDADLRLRGIALRAAGALQAPLAGVDILPGRDGQHYLLEVNAVPGWRATAAALGVDVAALVWEYLEHAAGVA